MAKKGLLVLFAVMMALLLVPSSITRAYGDVITINIGQEINIPDEEFGCSNSDSEASSFGLFSGEVDFLYVIKEQNDDSFLNQDSILFDLEDQKSFQTQVKLNYHYNFQDKSKFYLGLNLIEEKIMDQEYKFDVALMETFMSHSFNSFGNLTIGKQKLNFGVGYAWTPTNLDNSQEKEGAYSVRWDLPYQRFNFTTVLISPYVDEKNSEPQFYERMNTTFKDVDLSISGSVTKDSKPKFGVDISKFIWDLEFYSAVNLEWRKTIELIEKTAPGPIGDLKTFELQENELKQYLDGILGVNYTLPGTNIILIGEYYYNQSGCSVEQIDEIAQAANYCTTKIKDPEYQMFNLSGIYRQTLSDLNEYFHPGNMGRHYLFARVQGLEYENVGMNILSILNIEDKSGLVGPEFNFSINNFTNVNVSGKVFFGNETSEYSSNIIQHQLTIGTTMNF